MRVEIYATVKDERYQVELNSYEVGLGKFVQDTSNLDELLDEAVALIKRAYTSPNE